MKLDIIITVAVLLKLIYMLYAHVVEFVFNAHFQRNRNVVMSN